MKPNEQALAQAIGKAIAFHRQTSGLTQEQVAEKLGLGNEAVSRLERGKVKPSIPRLLQLAELFNCEAAALLREASPRASEKAKHLEQLLEALGEADRMLVVGMMETLVNRLKPPKD